MSDLHDHEPDAFDADLADAESHVEAGNLQIEVTVTVPVAASTLTALTERAHREGRNVEAVIADALQAAA
jgi:oxalate decarboxylase/phosphoglucose isomerase-like protein (cupin superfamily)